MRARLPTAVFLVLASSSVACGGSDESNANGADTSVSSDALDASNETSSETSGDVLDASGDTTKDGGSDGGASATSIAAGTGHTCAVIVGGTLKCWGWNVVGQLGDGSTTDRLTPVSVTGLTSGVIGLAAGYAHTCVVTSGGAVQCWGLNDNGQLGIGTTGQRHTPVAVTGLSSGITAIATGYAHSCALTTAGAVQCWGANAYGQLGDGTATQRLTPVAVTGLSSAVIAIVAGSFHTCALLSTGSVQCWGWNELGQLGDGTVVKRLSPVAVVGLSGVATIAAGQRQTCAVTTAGAMHCWGFNGFGQLGDGTTTQRNAPVAVTGLTSGVKAIASGGDHTCAVTSAGGVQCFGDNGAGQLGDGTVMRRLTPVDVSGLSSGVAILGLPNSGGPQSCSISTDGSIRCWGTNSKGQLGDGTTTDRHVPTPVVGFP